MSKRLLWRLGTRESKETGCVPFCGGGDGDVESEGGKGKPKPGHRNGNIEGFARTGLMFLEEASNFRLFVNYSNEGKRNRSATRNEKWDLRVKT